MVPNTTQVQCKFWLNCDCGRYSLLPCAMIYKLRVVGYAFMCFILLIPIPIHVQTFTKSLMPSLLLRITSNT